MDLPRVAAALKDFKVPSFRLDQVRRAVFDEAVPSYKDITVLPQELRERLSAAVPLMSAGERRVEVSDDRRAHKALLTLSDRQIVETVLLRPSETRWTTCISTQVGCAVGCTFCATGLMGLTRNLTVEEITDQVLFWKQYMRREAIDGRLDNVVYMGMGEPFSTYDNTAESLRRLMDQKQFGIGARHISVSTSGVAPRIEQFGKDFPQVNLALSLHSADDKLRSKLVPINKAYPLSRLSEALRTYLSLTNRKVFLEYVMLQGENDGDEDAQKLIDWIRATGPLELLHVNLILFNKTDTPHESTAEDNARRFQNLLLREDIKATVRQNLGRDIQGACGQLIVSEREASR